MENLMSRYRNVSILVAILFVQVLGLAVQVKRRSGADESTRIIRLWTVSAVTPLEKALVWCQNGVGGLWSNYIYLRGVRQDNRDLKFEIERLRLEQVRLSEDAAQARRLQALLGFKEQYIAKTVAAQVIGSSGSEQSRSIYIDKGTSAGVEKDMAVITADGLVGKVLRAYGSSSQVLLINDQSSGVGVILDKSRLQGVIKGTAGGEVILEKVMTGEQVNPGDLIVTSGGDQIFPKGITVATVMKVSPGADLFLNIRVKPAASLSRLEEVLVITKKEDRAPSVAETNSVRAVDILTQRLPSVPDKPAADAKQPATETAAKPATVPKAAPAATKALPKTTKPAAVPGPTQPAASERGTSEDKPN
jgi:rod shape-determining protein MreC